MEHQRESKARTPDTLEMDGSIDAAGHDLRGRT
jgi:hypothetical protein